MALTEVKRSRSRIGDKAGTEFVYKVEIVYTAPESEIPAHETERWGSTSTLIGVAGELPATRVTTLGKDPDQVGNGLIKVTYQRILTYDPSTFPFGSATMSMRTKLSSRPITDDGTERGLFIEQPPDDTGLITRVVGGPRNTPQVDGLISVRTSYSQPVQWRNLIALRRGRVNSNAMPRMMEVEENEVLLIHADVPQGYRFGDPKEPVPIEYIFWWKIGGWDTLTTLQHRLSLPIKRPVIHPKTLATEQYWYENNSTGIAIIASPGQLVDPKTSPVLFRDVVGQWEFQATFPYEEIELANFEDIHALL